MPVSRFVSGIQWATMQLVVTLGITVARLYVLTRYLTPADFGTMAIVTLVFSIAELSAEFGLHVSVLHLPELTFSKRSTLFWLYIILGVLVGFLLWLIAPWIVLFYGTFELGSILSFSACVLLVSSLGRVQLALEQKRMNFKRIAMVSVCSELLSAAVAIAFAVNGYGIWAILYGMLAGALLQNTIYLTIGALVQKNIGFCFDVSEAGYFLKVGGFYLSANFVGLLVGNLDIFLVERMLGLESLGRYSLAKQLAQKPLSLSGPVIQKVFGPYLAYIRHQSDAVRSKYLRLVNINSLINMVITFCFLCCSGWVVSHLYGEGYADIIPVARWLSLFVLLRMINSPVMSLSAAQGRTQYNLQWNMLQLVVIPLFLLPGVWMGMEGMAIAMVMMRVSLYYPSWYFFGRRLAGVSFSEQCRANFTFSRENVRAYAEVLVGMLRR